MFFILANPLTRYFTFLVTAYFMITQLLFYPSSNLPTTPTEYGLTFKDVTLKSSDSTLLSSWHIQAPNSKYTLLYLHGNAGNISDRLDKAKGWVDAGVSLLLVDYRGFGKSQGKIKEGKDLVEDAKAGLNYLEETGLNRNQILIYGESIGSYPALELSSKESVKGVILEGSFTELKDLVKIHYFSVPEFIYQAFRFQNTSLVSQSKNPIFFIHGSKDATCPIWMGKKLFELTVQKKEIFEIEEGTHNSNYDGYPEGVTQNALNFFNHV